MLVARVNARRHTIVNTTGFLLRSYLSHGFGQISPRRCAPIGVRARKKDAIGVRVTLLPSKQILRIRVPDGVLFFVFLAVLGVRGPLLSFYPPQAAR